MDSFEQSSVETRTFHIRSERVEDVKSKLEALSRRSEKLGLPKMKVTFSEPGSDQDGIERVPVLIEAPVIKLNGWRVSAKIEHDAAGNLVSLYGSAGNPDESEVRLRKGQKAEAKCDHCSVARNRKVTFLMHSADGYAREAQVGSSCLKDFTGHANPMTILALAEDFEQTFEAVECLGNTPGMSMAVERPSTVAEVIAAAWACVEKDGKWRPREHNKLGTVDDVKRLLRGEHGGRDSIGDVHHKMADETIAFLQSERFSQRGSEYTHKLRTLASRSHVDAEKVGLVASAVAAHQRYKRKAESADAKSASKPTYVSEWRGEKDKKITTVIVVDGDPGVNTKYGTKTLSILRDLETGAKLTWLNSGRSALAEGETYNITGTVKAHVERDGLRETILSRVTSPELDVLKHIHECRFHGNLDIESIRKKAAKSGSLDCRGGDLFGRATPVTLACDVYRCFKQNAEAIEWFIDQGASLSKQDVDGHCAFDYLVMSEDDALVSKALKAEPDLASLWPTTRLAEYEISSANIASMFEEFSRQGLLENSKAPMGPS